MKFIHPVFHVSMLEPVSTSTIPGCIQPPPPPLVEIEGEPEYEVAEVLDSKINHRCKCKLLYLVCWLGYEGTNEEYSWVTLDDLQNALELLQEFHSNYPTKPGPVSQL